jgi:hypothetical protein
MADTTAPAKPEDDGGLFGFFNGFLSKIWDKTGGKIEKAANDFLDNNIAPMATMILEFLKGFFRDTMGWSTFGNGGMGAQMIDSLEGAFKADPAPAATPDPKLQPPAAQPVAAAPAP